MAGNTKDTGWRIICTDRESILGKMVGNMMETIIWIRSMGSGYISGQMEGSMRECGKMVNNMERVDIRLLMVNQEEDFGKMAKELNG
jgi:hypothetical protein